MRIGIDMDDTICNTTQIVQDRLKKYASSNNLNELDIMNDEELKQGFFNIYLEDIYTNVTPKEDALRVVKRLKSRGNEIYIITSRSNNFSNTVKNVEEITSSWLKKYGIEVTKDPKLKAKQIRFLMYRGFEMDAIIKAINRKAED